MIKLEINGLGFFVKPTLSVLEACKYVGINVPRFCYHETLSVAGNCRMCLVEISNSPKPVASCALPVLNNMKIFINTPLVKKARENVLETLLLNHPLDCPICDQAGECDLQDQAKLFGTDYSRFFFNKRSVEDKYCGPLIKTIMTRCIHCTRCVRFSTEVAGVPLLGTLNRGGTTEIGGYTSSVFNSEISGNIIDLCPVGALTSKPYAFKARPWELKSIESIDLTDSLGSNIYINYKETEIMRILPKINNTLNDSIISDKARFSYDTQINNRLTKIFEFNESISTFEAKSKQEFFSSFFLSKKENLFIIDEQLDFETIEALKVLSTTNKKTSIKSISTSLINNSNVFINFNSSPIKDLNYKSKLAFMFGTNPRLENALINTKIRLKLINTDFNIYSFGMNSKSNFAINFINLNINFVILFLDGKLPSLSKLLIKSIKPIIFIGNSLLKRNLKFEKILDLVNKINPSSILINLLSSSNSASLKISNINELTTNDLKKANNIYFINLDNNFIIAKIMSKIKNKNLIWFNTHGSKLAKNCKVILPIASYFENESIHINLEYRPQKAYKVLEKLQDSFILKDLIMVLINDKSLKNNDKNYNNYIAELIRKPNVFNKNKIKFLSYLLINYYSSHNSLISLYPLKADLEDFYKNSKDTKNSLIMNRCSKENRKISLNF